ncbi:polysaccharide deacetylase domain protein [Bacillus sp. JCM 19045]|nr:polysaccharide deacetylase domain protein [Bacillus sp. JCM 19045]
MVLHKQKTAFKKRWLLGGLLCTLFVSGCTSDQPYKGEILQPINRFIDDIKKVVPNANDDFNEIDLSPFQRTPHAWGEFLEGVKTELDTTEKVIALTFDACGGPNGSRIDEELIRYLITNEIPSTLFVNARWIKENQEKIFRARQ